MVKITEQGKPARFISTQRMSYYRSVHLGVFSDKDVIIGECENNLKKHLKFLFVLAQMNTPMDSLTNCVGKDQCVSEE